MYITLWECPLYVHNAMGRVHLYVHNAMGRVHLYVHNALYV